MPEKKFWGWGLDGEEGFPLIWGIFYAFRLLYEERIHWGVGG